MKAKEGLTPAEVTARMDHELKSACEVLNSEKLRRDAFQICVLWRLLQEPDDPGYAYNLIKLSKLTRAVGKRCRETEFESAAQWCESVQAAVEGLELGVDRNASMHLLGHAALNLNHVIEPQKTVPEHLKTVQATVAMIRARESGRTNAQKQPLAASGG
jgi:hypothetical protein